MQTVQEAFNHDIRTSISIGISVYPEDGTTFQSLYSSADKALYYVKAHGKDNCAFYDASMDR